MTKALEALLWDLWHCQEHFFETLWHWLGKRLTDKLVSPCVYGLVPLIIIYIFLVNHSFSLLAVSVYSIVTFFTIFFGGRGPDRNDDCPLNYLTLTRSLARGPQCWTEQGWLCFEEAGSQQRRWSLQHSSWRESWHMMLKVTNWHLRRGEEEENRYRVCCVADELQRRDSSSSTIRPRASFLNAIQLRTGERSLRTESMSLDSTGQ